VIGARTDAGSTPWSEPADAAAPAASHQTCAEILTDQLPDQLECLGLFADIGTKRVAEGVREFQPAQQLWSDGADKTRWIHLPDGTEIDTSDPDEWKFPIGTKLFKEFRWKGHRAETRVFWKVDDHRWQRSSYRWNETETAAQRFGGGDVEVAGEDYHIPTAKECDQCHKGRTDSILGFEAVLLALPGSTGYTLSKLLSEQRVTDTAQLSALHLGDDGTGHASVALPWLHVNCGISCHNLNTAAEAFKTKLSFRLRVKDLNGESLQGVDARATSIRQRAVTPRWSGRTRIVPGAPDDSLVVFLASRRQPGMPRDQMPPIATRVVPTEGVEALKQWITKLGNGAEATDAGTQVP
jgi:hypothetical protein